MNRGDKSHQEADNIITCFGDKTGVLKVPEHYFVEMFSEKLPGEGLVRFQPSYRPGRAEDGNSNFFQGVDHAQGKRSGGGYNNQIGGNGAGVIDHTRWLGEGAESVFVHQLEDARVPDLRVGEYFGPGSSLDVLDRDLSLGPASNDEDPIYRAGRWPKNYLCRLYDISHTAPVNILTISVPKSLASEITHHPCLFSPPFRCFPG